MPRSDCAFAQSDLGLRFPQLPGGRLFVRHGKDYQVCILLGQIRSMVGMPRFLIDFRWHTSRMFQESITFMVDYNNYVTLKVACVKLPNNYY